MAAADTDVFLDLDHVTHLGAVNRARGTPDQTDRIATVIAGPRDQLIPVPVALSNETRATAVRLCAGPNAIIAARAPIEIDDENAVALDEALVQGEVQQFRVVHVASRVSTLLDARGRRLPDLIVNSWLLEQVRHKALTHLDQLGVSNGRGRGEPPALIEKQFDVSECHALGQV
jgi:hypothetical protein